MYYVGLDVGGTFVKGGIIDETGKILIKDSIPTGVGRPHSEIIKDWANFYLKLLADAGLSRAEVSGVGIGIPGTIDDETGVVAYANNFGWRQIPIRQEFSKWCDVEIHMGNDANCAALGETKFGAGKGYNNTVLFTLGTGVGAGIVIDGKLLLGNNSAGAEMGHMSIMMDGELCTCGRRGCIEAYASATALIRDTRRAIEKNPDTMMREVPFDEVNGKTCFDYARLGDKTAQEVVANYQRYLAEAIIDAVNIFRPEIVMIGGGVSYQGDYLLEPIRRMVDKYSYGGDINPRVVIQPATLGNDAGFIGAAALLM